jgi:hypothetical protein
VAELATVPICSLKTVHQNKTILAPHQSIPQSARDLWATGGLRAFYRCSAASVSSQVISTTCKFTCYKYLERQRVAEPLFAYNSIGYHVSNGIAAGLVGTLLTHPIEFVRIQWQMAGRVWPLVRQEGPLVVYRGLSKGLLKVLVGSSCYWPVYDVLRQRDWGVGAASFTTAVVATVCCHVPDLWKTRQVYNGSVRMWAPNGGVRGYFTGLTLNLARIVPHFFILMNVIEYLDHRDDNSGRSKREK